MFGGKFKEIDDDTTMWENGNISKLIRIFEPEYQLVIVAYTNYSLQYVFWRGGNRLDTYGQSSYEVKLK